MRIARINLDLQVTKTTLDEKTAALIAKGIDEGWAKGTAHRYFVRKHFNSDRDAYIARISGLVKRAHKVAADLVVLPATSILVSKTDVTLDDYAALMPKGVTMVAGILDVTQLGVKGEDKREGSIVLKRTGADRSFPTNLKQMGVSAGRLLDQPAIVAVSSTVKGVREHSQDHFFPDESRRLHGLLVIDLGHEQYNGRYKLTLDSVHRAAQLKWGVKKAYVVLAQWLYTGYSGDYGWTVPDRMAKSVLGRDKAKSDAPRDELDLITIP